MHFLASGAAGSSVRGVVLRASHIGVLGGALGGALGEHFLASGTAGRSAAGWVGAVCSRCVGEEVMRVFEVEVGVRWSMLCRGEAGCVFVCLWWGGWELGRLGVPSMRRRLWSAWPRTVGGRAHVCVCVCVNVCVCVCVCGSLWE